MMTDEKLIEWLRKIKEHCKSCKICVHCKFNTTDEQRRHDCQLRRLALYLWRNTPDKWEMEKIERIIRL